MSHQSCCVVDCKNTGRNNPNCKFYTFPVASWKAIQRIQWIAAVRRKNVDGSPWYPKPRDAICSDHFIGGKKSDIVASPSYTPTIFPPVYKRCKVNEASVLKRDKRYKERIIRKKIASTMSSTTNSVLNITEPSELITDNPPDVLPVQYINCNVSSSTFICNRYVSDVRSVKEERDLVDQNTTSNQPWLEERTNASETPCLLNIYSQIKTEEIEFKLEDLHHSIDIKEEPPTLETQSKSEYKSETGLKRFACDICKYKCRGKSILKIHLRTHTGEKPFECEICDYKCSRRSDLKCHAITHTGNKLFSCTVCDHKFPRKNSLNRHLKIHTGERPFVCNVCDFKCIENGQLKRHLKTHTSEKPQHMCEICDFECVHKNRLNEHLRSHTDRKLLCAICGYKCARKMSLIIHLRMHTREKRKCMNL